MRVKRRCVNIARVEETSFQFLVLKNGIPRCIRPPEYWKRDYPQRQQHHGHQRQTQNFSRAQLCGTHSPPRRTQPRNPLPLGSTHS